MVADNVRDNGCLPFHWFIWIPQRGNGPMLRKILAGSRYLVVIAVIGSFLASIGVLVYGGLTVVSVMFEAFSHATFTLDGAKHLELERIEIIDLFLLGTVF